MSEYVIYGGKRLEGEVFVDGSKNAVLPIMAATLLSGEVTYLENCPKILDVEIMIEILKQLGCQVEWQGKILKIDTKSLQTFDIDESLVKKMRSSIILLGALIGRCGEAKICQPGGCQLGARPIDLHLSSLKKLGVEINQNNESILCKSTHLRGAIIHLNLPSVGATENIMLTATLAEGDTVIYNAAKEPEIIDLQNYLNTCGAKVYGAGTQTIYIKGVKSLRGASYQVIPDRIIAGTYLVAAAITRGEVTLRKVNVESLKAIIEKLQEIGCQIRTEENLVHLVAPYRLKGTQIITAPYPGYPTDMQSQMMALLCTCETPSQIQENLFESRFKTAEELNKMGAKITINEHTASIMPNCKLTGCRIQAKDLRGGAALVLAGLAADGCTIVEDIEHIKRGYEDIVGDLMNLGGLISEKN